MTVNFSYRLLRKLGVLPYINFVRKELIGRNTTYIPVIRGTTAESSEKWMSRILGYCMEMTRGAVLDVGANLGQTLVKVKALDPLREYVGFEPNPTCVAYLEELLLVNHYVKCTVLPVGIAQRDGLAMLDLYTDGQTDSCASLIPAFRASQDVRKQKVVPVMSVNTVAQTIGLSNVGIIKIDVEGAELEVLKSFSDIIAKARPLLIVEVLPVYSTDNHDRLKRQQEVEALIEGHGYSLMRIRKTPANELLGLESIESIGIHGDLSSCDYLVCPKDMAGSVREFAANDRGSRPQ